MEVIAEIDTQTTHSTVKISPLATSCVVFNAQSLSCYRLSRHVELAWRRIGSPIVDCTFIDDGRLLVSTRDVPPIVVKVSDGSDVGHIHSPVPTTLRTRYGKLYTHTDGRIFLRTSYPFQLVELEQQSLVAGKMLSAEALTNVVFHPVLPAFVGVADTCSQELVIGSFENKPLFYESSFNVLPYLYALGMSPSGRNLHVLGNNGSEACLVTIDLARQIIVGTYALELGLKSSVELPGNFDKVVVTPKVLPVMGENAVLVFANDGNASVVNVVSGTEQVVLSPHRQTVCTAAQSRNLKTMVSVDWKGGLALWELGVACKIDAFAPWTFLQECTGVGSPFETKPVRLAYQPFDFP